MTQQEKQAKKDAFVERKGIGPQVSARLDAMISNGDYERINKSIAVAYLLYTEGHNYLDDALTLARRYGLVNHGLKHAASLEDNQFSRVVREFETCFEQGSAQLFTNLWADFHKQLDQFIENMTISTDADGE
ncbi:MAG: hypothetical protein IJR13_07635 [Bacteroidales bacterium]|nr:hypothetical protein [Bacteroidales bacterium]